MPGFLDDETLSANAITRAVEKRKALGQPLIDLTSTNPTAHGHIFPAHILEEEARKYFTARSYEPHPKGLPSARQSIADYYNRRQSAVKIDPEQIFITASTSEAYSLLFTLLCDAGDNVLAPRFSYPLFDLLSACRAIDLNGYEVLEDNGNWAIAEPSMLQGVDNGTRAVLLISPHNPSGMIVSKRLEILNRLRLPVICDEVFCEIVRSNTSTPPFFALHTDIPVFILNGISKMFALPDLKLGWIVLNEPAFRLYGDRLEILNDLFLGANTLAQSMLPSLFEKGFHFVDAMRARIDANLQSAVEFFSDCQEAQLSLPKGGYMLTLRLKQSCDEEELVLKLIEKGVLVHPGYFYGNVEKSYLIFSALVEPRRFSEGLLLIKGGLSDSNITY